MRFALPVANEALERSGSMAHEATSRIHREELDRAAAADRERQRNAPAFDFKLATMYPNLSEEERRKKMERLTPAEEKAMQEANARVLAERAAQDHEALIEGERKSAKIRSNNLRAGRAARIRLLGRAAHPGTGS